MRSPKLEPRSKIRKAIHKHKLRENVSIFDSIFKFCRKVGDNEFLVEALLQNFSINSLYLLIIYERFIYFSAF